MLFVLAALFASFADYPLCSFFILINIFCKVYYEFKSYTYYFEKYLLDNWMFSKMLFKIRNAFKQTFYKVLHKHQLLSIHIVKDMREKRICYSSFINYIRTFYQRAIYPKGLLLSSLPDHLHQSEK